MKPTTMITIYGMPDSGNCYKPRLLCALTGRSFRHVHVSTRDGGTASAQYKAKNANGKVPLLETDDGRFLPESNAILCYLGEGTAFMPDDRFDRATMLSWMFFEQYSHEPCVAVRRSLTIHSERAAEATPERMEQTLEEGHRALALMEGRLAAADWLVGTRPSLADISLYAYTHCAGEGGFEMERYPGIRRWLRKMEELAGYRPIDWIPSP